MFNHFFQFKTANHYILNKCAVSVSGFPLFPRKTQQLTTRPQGDNTICSHLGARKCCFKVFHTKPLFSMLFAMYPNINITWNRAFQRQFLSPLTSRISVCKHSDEGLRSFLFELSDILWINKSLAKQPITRRMIKMQYYHKVVFL
jgi:hypothetical protein